MHIIDFRGFDDCVSDSWEQFIAAIRSALGTSLAVVIRSFGKGETNERLIKLADSLGTPHGGPGLPQHRLEDRLIFRVEALGDGLRDEAGSTIYSTSADDFPCHTDGTNRIDPYDIVVLHCIRQAGTGGDTILVRLDEIVKHLPAETIDILREPAYSYQLGRTSIISGQGEEMWIRYNKQELLEHSGAETALSERNSRALSQLENVINERGGVQHRFRLNDGDCLIVDNRRVLHGRIAFPKDSKRLLKRIRIFLNQKAEHTN